MIERLQAAGVPVRAIVNPLRGIARRYGLRGQRVQPDPRAGPGRRPLLRRRDHHQCRHGRRQRRRPGLRGRLCPREGETLQDIVGRFDGQRAEPPPLRRAQYPTGSGTATEFADRPGAVPRRCSPLTFRSSRPPSWRPTQRPVAAGRVRASRTARRPGRTCRPGPSSAPATRPPAADVVRSMAQRAGAEITEVEGSHVIMISQPQAVTDVIHESAAERGLMTTSPPPPATRSRASSSGPSFSARRPRFRAGRSCRC